MLTRPEPHDVARPDRHDVARFVGAYVALTAVWYLMGKAVMASDALVREDERVARWFVDGRTPRMDTLTAIGSGLAETWVKVLATLIAVVVCRLVFHRWLESLVLALPLVLEASVFITVTFLVKRPRPPVPRLDGSPVDSSFPSGHVAAAVVYGAAFLVVTLHSRRWWPRVLVLVLSVAVAFAVAWSRMYRGMHHLTDVVAGAALGLSSVVVACWIVRGMWSRAVAEPGEVVLLDDEREVPGWLSA